MADQPHAVRKRHDRNGLVFDLKSRWAFDESNECTVTGFTGFFIAARQQALGYRVADESGGAGDEDFHWPVIPTFSNFCNFTRVTCEKNL